MTEQQLSLLPFYAGWGRYERRLVAAIAFTLVLLIGWYNAVLVCQADRAQHFSSSRRFVS
jgi:hypothetical protein